MAKHQASNSAVSEIQPQPLTDELGNTETEKEPTADNQGGPQDEPTNTDNTSSETDTNAEPTQIHGQPFTILEPPEGITETGVSVLILTLRQGDKTAYFERPYAPAQKVDGVYIGGELLEFEGTQFNPFKQRPEHVLKVVQVEDIESAIADKESRGWTFFASAQSA